MHAIRTYIFAKATHAAAWFVCSSWSNCQKLLLNRSYLIPNLKFSPTAKLSHFSAGGVYFELTCTSVVLVAAVTKCIDHSTFLHCVLLSVICFVEQIISCQSMNAEAVDVLKPMIMPIWFV